MIPEDVNSFILKCLAKLPEDRFETATEAKDLLMKILARLGGCKKYQHATVVNTVEKEESQNGTSPTPVSEERDRVLDSDLDFHEPVEAPAGATPAPQTGFDPDLDLD